VKSKDVILVGGGPVGCLLGILLARRNFRVQIFERRPDLRTTQISAGRSINLALSVRGIHALRTCGLDQEILARAIPMYGRMMHAPDGELAFQRYGMDDSQYINSISRGELNKALLSRAEREPNVKIHFRNRATAFDVDSNTVHFTEELSGGVKKFQAPFVLGCDGSASVLRDELAKKSKIESAEVPLDYGYKEFTILPQPSPDPFRMKKNALHIWPRGSHMLIALPNYDGSFTCTLFLPWKGPLSFESLHSGSDAQAFFQRDFPDALAMVDRLGETFLENPTGHMVTVRCRPWNHAGRVQLVGDAAHAIVPFFGQGLNCGFEDCVLLDQILEKTGDLGESFRIFSAERLTDANAIADLALENFVEMRDKVGQKRFLLEKEIEKLLMTKFPDRYVSKYSMVTFSRTPYRHALAAGKVQDEILRELSEGLNSIEHLNLEKAETLIRAKLSPSKGL
jgi:kynurenine 3-monooxygenase